MRDMSQDDISVTSLRLDTQLSDCDLALHDPHCLYQYCLCHQRNSITAWMYGVDCGSVFRVKDIAGLMVSWNRWRERTSDEVQAVGDV